MVMKRHQQRRTRTGVCKKPECLGDWRSTGSECVCVSVICVTSGWMFVLQNQKGDLHPPLSVPCLSPAGWRSPARPACAAAERRCPFQPLSGRAQPAARPVARRAPSLPGRREHHQLRASSEQQDHANCIFIASGVSPLESFELNTLQNKSRLCSPRC